MAFFWFARCSGQLAAVQHARRLVSILVVLLGAAAPGSAREGDIIWIDYPEEGAVLGQGYDLLKGSVTYGTCVDFVPIQDPSQSVSYRFEEVNSSTEVVSNTQISASGSMKMAMINASARLSFLSNEKFTLKTSKFLLNATVTNSALFAAPSLDYKKGGLVAAPSVAAGTPSGQSPADKFANRNAISIKPNESLQNITKCGQGFVAAIVSGAAVDSFLTMSKQNADALAEIKGSLEADIGSVFKVSGSFEQQQSSKKAQDATTISVFRYGGSEGKVAYDLEELKKSLADLVKDAATAPKPVRIGIIPYNRIDTSFLSGYGASTFYEQIAAYFLSKDVVDRTTDTLRLMQDVPDQAKGPRVPGDRPLLLASDVGTYEGLNNRALRLANRLSIMLSLCREDANAANDELGKPDPAAAARSVVLGAAARAFGTTKALSRSERSSINQTLRVGPVRADGAPAPSQPSEADMEQLFEQDAVALSKEIPSNATEAEASAIIESRIDACAVRPASGKPPTFLWLAPQYALVLTANDLATRPTYWSELGQRYREKVRLEIEKAVAAAGVAAAKDLNPVQVRAALMPVLEEFHKLYRVAGLRRGICKGDAGHPICATGSDWMALATPTGAIMRPELTQVLAELGLPQ